MSHPSGLTVRLPSRSAQDLRSAPLDCGNCLRGLRWQSGFHPCQEALASRDNERPVDLDVELTHFPADNLDFGVEPSPKLFGHRERSVAITEAGRALQTAGDHDLRGYAL
jgi:hypothetical protein